MGNRYIGLTSNGMKIETQLKNDKITSAYPVYLKTATEASHGHFVHSARL